MEQSVCVLGGDARQGYLARALCEMGYRVVLWGLSSRGGGARCVREWREAIAEAESVILPLPLSQDEVRLYAPQAEEGGMRLSLLWEACRGRQVYAGRVSPRLEKQAGEAGVMLRDYYSLEALQMRNALPTVEGALALAMDALPVTICGTRIAVIGYGRIGSLLAQRLAVLGGRVTVYARKERDRLHATLYGMDAEPLLLDREGAKGLCLPSGLRAVFNTVPAPVFSERVLSQLPLDCLLMDLASFPGGIDAVAAKKRGLTVVQATALPGRCFPESAGRILATTISELMEEEGENQC